MRCNREGVGRWEPGVRSWEWAGSHAQTWGRGYKPMGAMLGYANMRQPPMRPSHGQLARFVVVWLLGEIPTLAFLTRR